MELSYLLLTVYVASAAVTLSAAVGAWRQRHRNNAAAPLCLVMSGLAWWATCSALQVTLPDDAVRVSAYYAGYAGVAAVVAGFYCETRALVDRDWRPGNRTRALLWIHPVLLQIVIVTDPWHHLMLTELTAPAGQPWLTWVPGPLFWVHTAYCYTLLAWCFGRLLHAGRQASSPLQRRQLRSMVLGALVPTLANIYTLTVRTRHPTPDITSCFFVITGLIHYYAVFWQGLFRLLPVARGLVFDNLGDAVYVMDTTGRVIDINQAGRRLARRMSPNLPTDLIGLPARMIVPHNRHRKILTDGQYPAKAADGEMDLDLRVSDLADSAGRALGRVVVIRDVTESTAQQRSLEQAHLRLMDQLATIDQLRHDLAELAVRDELTGLHNRRHLMGRLEECLERARSDDGWLSVILLDIDHFKSVNDRFGHAIGDELLVATAKALLTCVRVHDTVARYGGEEFVVLLPGATLDSALATAEALRNLCSTVLVDSRQGPVSTTVSAGVASFPLCGWSGSDLLQAADEALYAAKAAGRDRVIAAEI